MASKAYATIRDAIQRRLQVVAVYKGYRREMCPHLVGKSKDGVEQALFYQFAGDSSKPLGPDGDPRNWRCIALDELVSITTREGSWHSAGNHARPQTCVVAIDVEVS